MPIIPTPFDAHDEIDEDALRGMVEYCATWGFKAICLPAYGGEFYKLSDQERLRVVRVACQQAAGRLPVIAQSNHGSAHVAQSEDDLLRYLTSVFNGVQVPCLVQDFQPGGVTINANFVARLVAECSNFRYIKFEEPMLSPKLKAIQQALGGRIGILDGTGGLYLMELIPDGLCGVMPGLAPGGLGGPGLQAAGGEQVC